MTRPSPLLTTGYRVPGAPKVYATEAQAYYAIAKRLVVEKYPPAFLDIDSDVIIDGLREEWRVCRLEKGYRLFYGEPSPGCFDSTKWVRVIRRVSRFLRFVDRKRGSAGVLRELHTGLLPAEEHALLQRTFEDAESRATKLLELADTVRAEIRRRAELEGA